MAGGEVNAHLTERFSRASFHDNSLVPNDNIPTAGPPRTNNDIRKYYELAKKPVTGGAWLDKAEIPSPSEVLPQTPQSAQESLIEISDSLRPHRVEGAYTSNEEYLGTTYDLLREDAIRPLREAIAEIQKDPYKNEAEYDNNSIGIYEPVYITSLVFSTRGLATRVAFSLSRVKKHIR
jgi:helicase required for RNAi-mediated heterochromatin assembly 1